MGKKSKKCIFGGNIILIVVFYLFMFLFLIKEENQVKFEISNPSIFFYWCSLNDARTEMMYGSIFSVLDNLKSLSFRITINIFFLDSMIPDDIQNHVAFLKSLNPLIPIIVRNISFAEMISWESNLNGTQLIWKHHYHRIVIMRFFIPFAFKSDFYVYLDSDMIAMRPFMKEMMTYASDLEKVIFCARDQGMVEKFPRRWANQIQVDPDNYMITGVVFMRGVEELLFELHRTIFFVFHCSFKLRFPDQDALASIVGLKRRGFLPPEFGCFAIYRSKVKNPIFIHFNRLPQDKRTSILTHPYYKAKAKFEKFSSVLNLKIDK